MREAYDLTREEYSKVNYNQKEQIGQLQEDIVVLKDLTVKKDLKISR
jgi:hypothetical protein